MPNKPKKRYFDLSTFDAILKQDAENRGYDRSSISNLINNLRTILKSPDLFNLLINKNFSVKDGGIAISANKSFDVECKHFRSGADIKRQHPSKIVITLTLN
jgi:hypothetical protein